MTLGADLPTTETGEFYHVRVRPGEVGRIALLPGDPDRVPLIAKFLDNPTRISEHREFTVYNGTTEGESVTVASTGIGSPAAAIVVEELARAGARVFIRVGTCGAIQREIGLGDLIVASAAVRLEGTSRQYVPPEYPAVADPDIVLALEEAAREIGVRAHTGLAASTDSFYVGQGRPGFGGYLPPDAANLVRELQAAHVLCFEMEAAAIFTLCNLYGLRGGAIFAAVANRVTNEFAYVGIERLAQTAVAAVRRLIRQQLET